MKKYFLIILLFGCINITAQESTYFFDIGSGSSELFNFSKTLTGNDIYSAKNNYGWEKEYSSQFKRDILLSRSVRDELTYDGIADKEIKFKIDLPKGNYNLIYWMEVAIDKEGTSQFFVDGINKNIVQHKLKGDEEGGLRPVAQYCVINTHFSSTGKTNELDWIGGIDSVRLLGIAIFPKDLKERESSRPISPKIKLAGQFNSNLELNDLRLVLQNRLKFDKNDPYYLYWYIQVSLLSEAERFHSQQGWEWIKDLTGYSIFDRMHQVLFLADSQIENSASGDNLLRERALWLRGKTCYDLVLERGGDYQRQIGLRDISELLKSYPDDEKLRMLNGESIYSPSECSVYSKDTNIPKWAALQLEAICRVRDGAEWWITKKQAPNGEFGGKIDDDVELLREWSPLLFYGNKNVITGWTKLANAIWNSPGVYKGYSKNILDVEHSAEFIADSTPELIIIDTSNIYLQRLEYTAEHFKNLWSVKNKFNHRFFKSSWYSSTELDERPPRNRDVDYNARALKPLRFLAWATQDSKYISLLEEWSEAWLSASLKSDKGKPVGIIPPSVRYYDESINGDEPNWYKANMMWSYYDWSHSSGSKILDNLVFTYTLTKKDSLLLPLEYSLELIDKLLKKKVDLKAGKFLEGSEEWAAQNLMNEEGFWNSVQIWRLLKGNIKYDSIISKYASYYVRYLMTGEKKILENGLNELLNVLRYNTPLRTDMVMHTDRVRIPGTSELRAMISGDGSPEGGSPFYAASWKNTDNNLAIVLEKFDNDNLIITTYYAGDSDKEFIVRPWLLESGNYKVIIDQKEAGSIFITKRGEEIPLTIPAKKETVIKIIKD
ncbi:MAG: hypothetical protein M0P71_02680 [Melioribacteraceae bacterium]|nr:hypothetical protein [Melioribacteraceae bacterium]